MEGSEIFPATAQVVDAAAPFKFAKSSTGWVAEVAKNEYAKSPINELSLVIARKNATDPLSLTWKSAVPKNP